jgi:hypothetical protein
VTALAGIISEVRDALGVGVEVLTHPTMLVQLPNGNDGLPADVGVLHNNGIRGSKLAHDAVISGLFGVSSIPSPEVALRRDEKIKFEKYSRGVRSRPDIRFIRFVVAEFGTLGGHATAFLTELAKLVAASNGMHVGKFLASWRRKVSLAVHVAHADNVLRDLSAAAYGVESQVHIVRSTSSDECPLLGDINSGCVGLSEALFEGVGVRVGVLVHSGSP